jgi:predicted ATPase
MIREICLKNLLSFGPDSPALPLRGLNLVIGPNGSGKSNLIEAISLLQSAPSALASPVRDGGGIRDWLWKGSKKPIASLEVVVDNRRGTEDLRHRIAFSELGQRFQLIDERIEDAVSLRPNTEPYVYYRFQNNQAMLNVKGKDRKLRREDVDPEQSILSQRRDPDQYPKISYLSAMYDRIRIYRDWSFGRFTPLRQAQRADERNDFLSESLTNLGLVLNRMRRDPTVKARALDLLSLLYADIRDFDVFVEAGSVQVFLQEGKFSIPATRLSDGTLRFLCLLAILCDPEPAPLICIEEPELGMHPDVLPGLADLLKEASTRTQVIVTTHSDALVEAFSESPEDVIISEKKAAQTVMRRLDSKSLAVWLKDFSLGQLWRAGKLGGNRW